MTLEDEDKSLRSAAVTRLQTDGPAAPAAGSHDLARLVHELQVHQIELEMQNQELRQARAEAETALNRYVALYDFAPVGYFDLDRKGVVRQVNLTGTRLLGCDRSDLLGRPLASWLAEESRADFGDLLARAAGGRSRESCEAALMAKHLPWQDAYVHIEAVVDEEHGGFRAAVLDISARCSKDFARGEKLEAIEASLAGDGEMRKRREIGAEQDRRRLEYRVAQQAGEIARLGEELERTVHEAGSAKRAKSTFLTNMSDEIRNPMNAIIGFVGLLRRRADLGADAQDMLGKIGDSARHLLSVLNDIIDYAKIEAGKVVLECAPFSPAELVGELSTLIGMRAKAKGLRFLVATNPLPPMLDGDTAHLRQALLHYLDNAVKFTEQGEIVLGARVMSQSDTEVTIRFTVEDTGIGVTAEQERHLFIPFEQVDNTSTRRFGGTGLGLAINRHLAHLMGGEVGVERRPGGGSIFWLTARFARSKAA